MTIIRYKFKQTHLIIPRHSGGLWLGSLHTGDGGERLGRTLSLNIDKNETSPPEESGDLLPGGYLDLGLVEDTSGEQSSRGERL